MSSQKLRKSRSRAFHVGNHSSPAKVVRKHLQTRPSKRPRLSTSSTPKHKRKLSASGSEETYEDGTDEESEDEEPEPVSRQPFALGPSGLANTPNRVIRRKPRASLTQAKNFANNKRRSRYPMMMASGSPRKRKRAASEYSDTDEDIASDEGPSGSTEQEELMDEEMNEDGDTTLRPEDIIPDSAADTEFDLIPEGKYQNDAQIPDRRVKF